MRWITHALSAVRQLPTAIASRAFSARSGHVLTSGHVTPAETRAKRNALLLSDIEILRAELMRAEKSHKRRTHIQRQIYSARHEILRNG